MHRRGILLAVLLLGTSTTLQTVGSPAGVADWPSRVLITNDDGIEDENRLVALARAFREIGAEVVIAVPLERPPPEPRPSPAPAA